MKSKKTKILICLAVVVLMFGAYNLGYHRGYASRGPLVMFGPDVADTGGSAPTEAGYDPYFTRVNAIPAGLR